MIFCLKVLHLILKLCYTPALVICRQSMSVMTSRLQKRWLQLEPKTKPQICQTHPQSQVQRSFQKNTPIKIIDSHDSNSCKDQDYLVNQFCSSTILHLLPSKNAALWFPPAVVPCLGSWTFRDVLCIYNFQRHIFPVSLNKTCQISPTEMSASPFLEIVGGGVDSLNIQTLDNRMKHLLRLCKSRKFVVSFQWNKAVHQNHQSGLRINIDWHILQL